MKHDEALIRAKWFVAALRPACERIEIVGSVRRGKAEVHDIELLLIAKNEKPVPEFGRPNSIHETKLDKVLADLHYGEILRHAADKKDGPKYKKRAIIGADGSNEFCLDMFIVSPPADWGVQCLIRTGPSDFSKWMVTNKSYGGALPNHLQVKDGAIWERGTDQGPVIPEEVNFFALCGLPYMEPGQRVARWKR